MSVRLLKHISFPGLPKSGLASQTCTTPQPQGEIKVLRELLIGFLTAIVTALKENGCALWTPTVAERDFSVILDNALVDELQPSGM